MKGIAQKMWKEGEDNLAPKEGPRKVKIILCWIQTALFGICAVKSLVIVSFEKVLDSQSLQRTSVLSLPGDPTALSRAVTRSYLWQPSSVTARGARSHQVLGKRKLNMKSKSYRKKKPGTSGPEIKHRWYELWL